MKHISTAALIMSVLFSASVAGADTIQISVTKKTADSRKSSTQQLPHGSTQLSQKSQYYRIDFRPMSPNLPDEAELQYVVLQENFDGRLEEAVRGTQSVALTFGREQSVESETFDLTKREFDHHLGGSGSMKEDVYGVGVRIVNRDGEVLAEKYVPSSKKKELEEALDRDPKKDLREPSGGGWLRKRLEGRRQVPVRRP